MTTQLDTPQEIIGFRRSSATPGIEIINARNSPREWRVVSPTFCLVLFNTWRGPINFGGRTHYGEPGVVFCNLPTELMVSRPEGDRPGSFDVLEFTPEVLREWLAEQCGPTLRPEWSATTQKVSPELGARFRRFFTAFASEASPLELQAELLELSEVMVHGLIAGMSERGARLEGPPIRGTARMRECLQEEGLDIDLETLARKVGLSRFQALRAFKRRYGLPPHAYQLAVRLGRARRMLSSGAAPLDVALHCGFVDQSHFNRHFKRAFGVTPAQCARAGGVYLPSPSSEAGPEKIVSRSDRNCR